MREKEKKRSGDESSGPPSLAVGQKLFLPSEIGRLVMSYGTSQSTEYLKLSQGKRTLINCNKNTIFIILRLYVL